MTLKIITINPDRKYYRIGKDFAYAVWYRSDRVKDVPVEKGDSVEIEAVKEGNETFITKLTVTSKAEVKTTSVSTEKPLSSANTSTEPSLSPSVNSESNGTKKEWRSKSVEESECIRKQTVGKMVAETVKAVTGLTKDNVNDVIRSLFQVYDELTH